MNTNTISASTLLDQFLEPVNRCLTQDAARQIVNFRMKPRGRPHNRHRLRCLTANLGVRADFTRWDVLATPGLLSCS